jgi:adenosylcobinamide-phosphate synthase
MAGDLIRLLGPDPVALLIAIIADLLLGDPVYRFHPVRLMGGALSIVERWLRSIGAGGYGGGIMLFVAMAVICLTSLVAVISMAILSRVWIAWAAHSFILYSLLALGDLLHHARQVERALTLGNLSAGRSAVAMLVGRDTDRLDAAACRRAAIESMSENLPDGFVSALFWYVFAGLPGVVLFKVVSTMDSMVGFKSARYLYFGWCGARLDDVLNFIPARLTCLLIAAAATCIPECSGRKSWIVAANQHGALPSPNSGWSEAAMAGAIQRRLVGPIWKDEQLVTEIWLGDLNDPPAATRSDFMRAVAVTFGGGVLAAALAEAILLLLWM